MKVCNQVSAGTRWMAMAVLAVGVSTGTVQGVVTLLEDDFSGPAGPVDTNKWTTLGGAINTLTGSGTANIDHTAAGGMIGNAAFHYAATSNDDRGRLTLAQVSRTGNSIFGLNNIADTDAIFIRNDGSDGVHYLVNMYTSAGGSSRSRVLTVPNTDVGTWVIDWFPGSVEIKLDGSPVFNSATDAPISGSWVIPTAALAPMVYGYTGSSDVYNSVLWEAIPEPSTLGLLGTAMALLGVRRFRR